MSSQRFIAVTLGVAYQCLRKLMRVPGKMLPAMLLPLFMFAAFGGALGALGKTPGFHYYSYTAFVFVFVVYMASMFSAVFTTFDIAGDYEGGFGSRMMLATPRRMAIVLGYVLVALGRGLLSVVVVFLIAVATGMSVKGNPLDVLGLVLLALGLNVAATLYGAGIALRLQSTAAGVLILIPTFMVFFLSPIFVPRTSLTGWLRDAADINPLTPVLESGRGLLADDPVKVGLAILSVAGLIAAFSLWAARGMRKAERGGGESSGRGGRRRGPPGRRAGQEEPEPAGAVAAPPAGAAH